MKKIIYLFLLSCCSLIQLKAQKAPGKGIEQPAPSVSSLAAYSRVPVSIQTGIPNISYGTFSVPTLNKNAVVSLDLSYHANNTSLDQWEGDLGRGWSLIGRCAISRENYDDADEKYAISTAHYYKKNEYDDVYSFSTLEESGKFRIRRDTLNNTFKLIKLTPFKSQIKFSRADDGSNLIFGSFTIISGTGIKYLYNTFNTATSNVYLYSTHDNTASGVLFKNIYDDIRYRSAFYLTSITDENDNTLVSYQYTKDIKYKTGTSFIKAEYNRMTKIVIASKGTIDIEYNDSGENKSYDNKTDQYFIKSFTLKDVNGKQVGKYILDYTGFRTLSSLKKYDKNNLLVGTTSFKSDGLLRMVQLPTKGTIVYDYESEPYYQWSRDSIVTHKQPTNSLGSTTFTTFGVTKKFFFSNPKDQNLAITLPSGSFGDTPWAFTIYRKEGSQYVVKANAGPAIDPDPNYPSTLYFDLPAGEYYSSLATYANPRPNISFGVDFNSSEYTTVQETVKIPQISKENVFRIKKISEYNDTWDNIESKQPIHTSTYDYNFFDTNQSSKATYEEGVYQSKENETKPYSTITIYRNVKVSDATGYEKYYFNTSSYNAPGPAKDYSQFYELIRGGVLDKKETYSTDNVLQNSETYTYDFKDFDQEEPYFYAPASYYPSFKVKPSYVSGVVKKTRAYLNGKYAETTSRTQMDFISNDAISACEVALQQETMPDGTVLETTYQYAKQKGNQLLLSKNVIDTPFEVEKKVNGKTVNKAITDYPTQDNYPSSQAGGLVLPLAIKTMDVQNNSTLYNVMKYDLYDTIGNPLQYTKPDNTVTTIIWGYNGTLPIAKIEGASYNQVSPYISDIILKSNGDVDNVSEQALQSALYTFRSNTSLANYQITTYVHDPFVGLKMITPPSGIKEFYIYDGAGRLKEIRENDETGNILKEYNYNYRP